MRLPRALLLTLFALTACKKDPPPPPPPAAPSEKDDADDDDMRAARKAAMEPDPEPTPVYGLDAGPPDKLAERFCAAVQDTPRLRAAECCKSTPSAPIAVDSCKRTLTAALRNGAITLTPEAVTACESAMKKALQGCDWVGSQGGIVPPECDGIIGGTLAQGATCRSSLECSGTLFCKGVGPLDTGTCQPAQKQGMCNAAVDSLAVWTRQDHSSERRPECEGWCDHHRCAEHQDTCEGKTPWECGVSARCVNGKCVPGRYAALGESCVGASCPGNLRCLEGTCQAPRKAGSPCHVHEECEGGCLIKLGQPSGVCGRFCGVSGTP